MSALASRMRVFGEHDARTVRQLERCLEQEDGSIGVLCADGHLGYSAPIGGVVAYREHVSPAAVGYDIGCGNLAVATSICDSGAFRTALPGLMDRIFGEVSFGMGRRDGQAADHPIIEEIAHATFTPQRELWRDAAKQLGTVGAGNHYVDLFVQDTPPYRVWVGVHFGSRGFGHKTASGFLAMAKGQTFTDRVGEGEMEAPPDVLLLDSALGSAYMSAMRLAGRYAYAGREVVVKQVLDILGAEPFGEPVHNHHNYAWREEHGGESFVVIRKGATPASPGQRGFVGATMGEPAVILEGVESEENTATLRSTVHGAGRAMSRTQAAGKSRKRWSCLNRDCDWTQQRGEQAPDGASTGGRGATCPTCGHIGLAKRWVQESQGLIDWGATLNDLHTRGIELRGGGADEAPGAYKRLEAVLGAHAGSVRSLHRLVPVGVAMAAPDTRDPWKD